MDALDASGNIPEYYLDPDGNVDLNDDNAAHYIYLMNQPPFRPRHAFARGNNGNNENTDEITRGLTSTHVISRQTPFTIPEPSFIIPDQSCGHTEETVPPPLR